MRRTTTMAAVATGLVAVLGLTACGGSGGSGSQVAASAKQTIVFATGGLGTEGAATKAAIAGFEKKHPNIKVTLLSVSSNSTIAEQQEQHYFIAGSATPDVVYTDVTWPSTFAQSGWLANLSKFHPKAGTYFPAQWQTTQSQGGTYAIPWFINAEGVYYRTDLVPSAPKTFSQLVSDAQAAQRSDPKLKEGLAFEGDEYEGAVTVWQAFGAQIGLSHLKNIDTPTNVAALTNMYDAISTDKITPTAATTWQEGNVQDAWTSGQTAFAVNWPYIYQLSEAKGSAVAGKTAWVPIPGPGGISQTALGGDDLAINASSTHQAAAWELIQYLTSVSVQQARAVTAGDPPSVKSAYNAALYAKASYYQAEQAVYNVVVARPVTPVYPQISTQLQSMISSVLSGQMTPAAALKATAPTVAQLQANA